jgi:anionic cell wall polymer biosynthesis LytR-Cps2A-Psr (LCP) family protein
MTSSYWPKSFIHVTTLVFVILGACVGSSIGMQKSITIKNPLHTLIQLHNLHSTKAKSTKTYLVVGVNSENPVEPSILEALWTISFSNKYDRVFLKGVSVTPALENQFIQSPKTLVKSIESLIPISITAEFILNRKQFTWIIDELGGISILGDNQNGASTIDYITRHKDLNIRTIRQAEAIQAMVARAEVLASSLEISSYVKHLRPEVKSLIDIDSIANNVFPVQSERIDIETFTTNNLDK